MKLLRVGAVGVEKPALLDPEMALRDLSGVTRDFDGETLSPAGIQKLASVDWKRLPKINGAPRIGPCVPRPLNFIGIGANFHDHIAEAGVPTPTEPFVFVLTANDCVRNFSYANTTRDLSESDRFIRPPAACVMHAGHLSEYLRGGRMKEPTAGPPGVSGQNAW
jgi:2-keto-4-pentenoate hydratase/2-oxohepta-3-ene-1,7-dioic acid hydratase in catechol pathway